MHDMIYSVPLLLLLSCTVTAFNRIGSGGRVSSTISQAGIETTIGPSTITLIITRMPSQVLITNSPLIGSPSL